MVEFTGSSYKLFLMKYFIYSILALFSCKVFAQSPKVSVDDYNATLGTEIDQATYEPSGQSNLNNWVTFTSLTTGRDEEIATMNLGVKLAGTLDAAFKLNTPFLKTDKLVKPVNQDGLLNGTSTSLSLSNIFFITQKNKYSDLWKTICPPPTDCTLNGIEKSKPQDYKDLIKAIGFPLLVGAKISTSKNKIGYITDTTTNAFIEEDRYSYTFLGSIGFIFKKNYGVLGISYIYTNSYKPAEEQTFLFPDNNNVYLEKKLYPAKPSDLLENRIKVEYLAQLLGKDEFKWNPSVSYIWTTNKFALDLPIYIVKLKKDDKLAGFDGGLFVSYLSGEDFELVNNNNNFTYGIFIGANFNSILDFNK